MTRPVSRLPYQVLDTQNRLIYQTDSLESLREYLTLCYYSGGHLYRGRKRLYVKVDAVEFLRLYSCI